MCTFKIWKKGKINLFDFPTSDKTVRIYVITRPETNVRGSSLFANDVNIASNVLQIHATKRTRLENVSVCM